MLRRYSKARAIASNVNNGDVPNNSKPPPPIAEVYEKRLQDLYKAAEESQKHIDQVSIPLPHRQIFFLLKLTQGLMIGGDEVKGFREYNSEGEILFKMKKKKNKEGKKESHLGWVGGGGG